jgi:hypothetical protein
MIEERITAEMLLADSVAVAESKLYVQGGAWNVLRAASLPVRQNRLGVAAVLRVPYRLADNTVRRFALRIEDEDGKPMALGLQPPAQGGQPVPITSVEGSFTIGRPAGLHPGDDQQLPMAINLDGIVFQRAGLYFLRLAIDGQEVKSLSFRVATA